MIEISSGETGNEVMAVGHGKVTAEDYERVLIPAIEEKLKSHKKVRLLFQLDRDFAGFTPGAVWDDAKFGLGHLTGFEAVAMVTDVVWIADGVKFFGAFMRFPIKVFGNEALAEAKEWVRTTKWRTVAEALAG